MSYIAIVPLAGRGNRLKPITDKLPKALVDVGGKPIAQRCVEQLLNAGINEFVFVIGYLGEQIEKHFREILPSGTTTHFYKQEVLDGTGGVLKLLKKDFDNRNFLMVFGDSFFADSAIGDLLTDQSKNSFAAVRVHDPERYGVVSLNENGFVEAIEEKPKNPTSNLVVGGMYKFDKSVWNYVDKLELSPRGEYELPDIIKLLLEDGELIRPVTISHMYDVGTVKELRRLNTLIQKGDLF
ncbi:nucleotidyltransferase family protein [Hellea sp.]|nr:nucleotidyltransferase family protein [Hellea sp.]